MNDYVNLRLDLEPCSEDMTDLLASFLADEDYESFVPDEKGLSAYVRSDKFSLEKVEEIISEFPFPTEISFTHSVEEGQDWNEEWEKNYFKPIIIGDKCVIHSTFHKDYPDAEFDITIDPKMAFGTGHHATTSMMITHILERDLNGKSVIDMGTGTGILAILSKMKGADRATGIEIDPGAAANARENVELNNASGNFKDKIEVEIIDGDASRLSLLAPADIFLANINRNVILADIPLYADAMKQGAELILSGFYEDDIEIIERAARLYGLSLKSTMTYPGNWASCVFNKD